MPGGMDFEFSMAGGKTSQRVETSPFVMMVLGDFGGNAGKITDDDPSWLMQVPVRNVDIDNIDQLWKVFTPKLEIDIEGSPVVLEPGDLDDFHPDYLYNNQPLFAELRKLRQRLLDPATSSEALAEVLQSSPKPANEASEPAPTGDQRQSESSDNMFERLLGERRAEPSPVAAASSRLDSLLQKVVGPHVVHELDPKVDTAVDAVDKAVAESMRRILHHPDFQALESAWRSLYELLQGAEINEELQLKVCNISKQSLLNGLPVSAESLEDCGLYQLLVGRFRRAADDDGFSLLLCNYYFGGGVDDVTLLAVHVADSTGSELALEWTTIGMVPDSYTVSVDGKTVADGISEVTLSIPLGELSPGEHHLTVIANGVGTRYELSFTEFDRIADELMPVVVEKIFHVK